MNIFKLGACMLADAALTVATGGVYLLTRNGYDSTSFTQDELNHERQKENFEAAVEVIKNLRKIKMNKLILLLLSLVLSACTSPVENKSIGGGLRCINGYLHYSVSGYDYFPLFDCNSDIPLLIQCNEVNGRIQYDREKVK